MSKVDYIVHRCNSEWARDIAPFFVVDHGKLKILDNHFNGWGEYPHKGNYELVYKITKKTHLEIVDFPLVLEGGAIEKFGRVLMTTRSNLLKRNPKYTECEITKILKEYLGVDEIIWLNGAESEDVTEDITDCHIDGYARLLDENTILTITENLTKEDVEILKNTQKHIVEVPCRGELSYLYLNYYIINNAVIVPVVNSDKTVLDFIQSMFTDKKIIPINVQGLHELGGAIHCITQQQAKIKGVKCVC